MQPNVFGTLLIVALLTATSRSAAVLEPYLRYIKILKDLNVSTMTISQQVESQIPPSISCPYIAMSLLNRPENELPCKISINWIAQSYVTSICKIFDINWASLVSKNYSFAVCYPFNYRRDRSSQQAFANQDIKAFDLLKSLNYWYKLLNGHKVNARSELEFSLAVRAVLSKNVSNVFPICKFFEKSKSLFLLFFYYPRFFRVVTDKAMLLAALDEMEGMDSLFIYFPFSQAFSFTEFLSKCTCPSEGLVRISADSFIKAAKVDLNRSFTGVTRFFKTYWPFFVAFVCQLDLLPFLLMLASFYNLEGALSGNGSCYGLLEVWSTHDVPYDMKFCRIPSESEWKNNSGKIFIPASYYYDYYLSKISSKNKGGRLQESEIWGFQFFFVMLGYTSQKDIILPRNSLVLNFLAFSGFDIPGFCESYLNSIHSRFVTYALSFMDNFPQLVMLFSLYSIDLYLIIRENVPLSVQSIDVQMQRRLLLTWLKRLLELEDHIFIRYKNYETSYATLDILTTDCYQTMMHHGLDLEKLDFCKNFVREKRNVAYSADLAFLFKLVVLHPNRSLFRRAFTGLVKDFGLYEQKFEGYLARNFPGDGWLEALLDDNISAVIFEPVAEYCVRLEQAFSKLFIARLFVQDVNWNFYENIIDHFSWNALHMNLGHPENDNVLKAFLHDQCANVQVTDPDVSEKLIDLHFDFIYSNMSLAELDAKYSDLLSPFFHHKY